MLMANVILSPRMSLLILTSRYILGDGVSWNTVCKGFQLLLTNSNPGQTSSGSFAQWAENQISHLPKANGSELSRAETGL